MTNKYQKVIHALNRALPNHCDPYELDWKLKNNQLSFIDYDIDVEMMRFDFDTYQFTMFPPFSCEEVKIKCMLAKTIIQNTLQI